MSKINIYLQRKYFDIIDFDYISNKIFGLNDFNIFEKENKNGQYIKLEFKGKYVYILLSRINAKESRNAYISQSISTSLGEIEKETKELFYNLNIFYYLVDLSKDARTDFNLYIYRGLETLGINMLNNEEFGDKIFPFTNFSDILNSKILMKKNQNNPSSFEELDKNINFFIKTFGANGKDSSFNCLVIYKITNKPIIIFQVEDNESVSISKTDKKLLENHKIFVDQENLIKDYIHKGLITKEEITSYRKQGRFKANLLKKFGEKKCYLCGCDIDKTLKASHIHRVTDISNDSLLSDEDKFTQTSDGDNGLWLCGTHDLLFEYGIIYFENNLLKINNELLKSAQKEFINNITTKYKIDDIYFNDNMDIYLNKHKERIGK